MADTERVVNGAKDLKPIAPEQDHFSWVTALQFLLQFFVQETCPALSNGKPIYLTAEQKTNFEEAYDIFFGSDVEGAVLRRLMWNLSDLTLLIHIEGFRGKNKVPVNLTQWATGKTVCLPVPFEELVLVDKDPADEVDNLAKKYVRGLLFEDEREELQLLDSPSALDMAKYGFYVLLEGVACAYRLLHKQPHGITDVWVAYDDVCQAIGAIRSWQEPQVLKRDSKRYLNYVRKKAFFDEWSKKWSTMEREDFLYECCKDGQKKGVSASRPTIYREMGVRGLT